MGINFDEFREVLVEDDDVEEVGAAQIENPANINLH